MPENITSKSRRRTPRKDATPLQSLIDQCAERDYSHRHPILDEMGEAYFLNSHEVTNCRYCGSDLIRKEEDSGNGNKRYRCKECGKRFRILTNTVFDSHKISISGWMGFLLDGIALEGDVWLDGTFVKVRRNDGKEYRGLPRNQLCVGIAPEDR
jgi:DNA-directed RNA polymerase subunit RPC12/RpoP